MRVKVLKTFPLYRDGFTREMVEASDELCEIPDHLAPALIADGLVEDPAAKAAPRKAKAEAKAEAKADEPPQDPPAEKPAA